METTIHKRSVTAVLGTYRKGGVIDGVVDEILDSARAEGSVTEKIYLTDRHIEFCNNCRVCTQQPGTIRGGCPLRDEMGDILDQLDRSDVIVLASPVNFFTVTAIMKRFIERLVCYAF
jgi:multimeric flavodoxin WrbA